MSLNLVKGQKVDLTKGTGITNINIGLGWDVSVAGMDLDASIITLKADGSYANTVYFGNLTAPGITHTGDNLTGEGDGDDETIKIDMASIPADIDRLKVVVNIYNAGSKNFGQVKNAFVRVIDTTDGKTVETARFDLSEDGSVFNGMVFAEVYRHNGEWKFAALEEGFNGDLNFAKTMF